MKVIVSGYTSPIGRKFIEFAISRGHEVVPLGSNEKNRWRLGDGLPNGLTADGYVHFAHDRSRDPRYIEEDIKLLLDDFSGHPILISTISAHKKAKSNYGKSKYVAENVFLSYGGTVLKCGLIIGEIENRFIRSLQEIAERFAILILPLNGKINLYFTNSKSLMEEIEFRLNHRTSGRIRAFSTLSMTMRAVIRKLNSGKRTLIFPLPKFISNLGINVLGILFPKSNSVDSLKSLLKEISFEEMRELHPPKVNFYSNQFPHE